MYLACDKSKIFRAKETLIKSSIISEEVRIMGEEIQGLFFDGKKYSTRVMKWNKESRNYHPAIINE